MNGFSLIEMAVVLMILGLLLSLFLMPLAASIENERRNETRDRMEEIKEALIGYAIVNGRLPCPDSNNDGLENSGCAALSSTSTGQLPWLNLGIDGHDSWGRYYAYAVSTNFTTPFTLTTEGALHICNNTACTRSLATKLPFIVLSTGKHNTEHSDAELENMDSDARFIEQDYSMQNSYEFDDLLTWVAPTVLISRLISAGKLP